MNEYIEGAAYVSPSEDRLYPTQTRGGTVGVLDQHGNFRVPGDRGIPADLVMVWKPRSEVRQVWTDKTIYAAGLVITTIESEAGHLDEDEIEELCGPEPEGWKSAKQRRREETESERHPSTRGWYLPPRYNATPGRYKDELGFDLGSNVVPLEPDQIFQNPEPTVIIHNWAMSEWHYPTHLNARPGKYIDEDSNEWEYRERSSGKRWFCITTGDNMHEAPMWMVDGNNKWIDNHKERLPIAVKWIGELDAPEGEDD